jgi:streptogramin lyase
VARFKLLPRSLYLLLVIIAASAATCSLTGCGGSNTTPGPPTPPPPTGSGVTFGGKALAGTNPIVGAAVQLYAAGTTGNGSIATSLLTAALTTDATGAFTVPAGYSCPASTSQLYLVIGGGSVGTAAANSAITLASVLGACGQLAASSQFVVNEVTTTATVWALSQFLTTSANLGASASNAQGLANAAATALNLANPTTGSSPGSAFPANGTSPAPRINAIANLLNSCTAAMSSAPCNQLFTATTPSGGSAPSNTFAAALNLARNPGHNVATLYTQSTSSTAFSPVPSTAFADWTLFINYTGGGMNQPGALSVDATGNIWVANYFGAVSEFSPTGTPVYPTGITSGGLNHSYGMAIDAQNNVWIPNEDTAGGVNGGIGSVTVLSSAGQPVSGASGYTAGGLNYPIAVAVDTNATTWVVNYGNSSLTLLSSTGQPLSGATGYTTPLFQFPVAIAVDASHNAWIANSAAATLTKVSPDGKTFTNYSCCNGPVAVALDQSGNVWAANYLGDSISEISSAGTVISNGYTGGGLAHPESLAIDGVGNVWVANFRGPSITELAGANSNAPGQILSPAAGFAPDAKLTQAFGIAVDPSGNLWVTNFGNQINVLTEFIGLAYPVKTPLIGLPKAP